MTTSHRRLRGAAAALLALVLLALAPATPPAAAQGGLILEATAAFEGNYAPNSWLPLSIVLRNDGPPTRATVSVGPPLAPARNAAVVDLPAGGEQRLTLYAALDRDSRELVVRAVAPDMAPAEQRVAVRPRPDERLLGLVSAQPLELSLPRREDLAALPFLAYPLEPAALPDRPAGLASLSILLVGTVPAQSLSPAQLATLLAWVRGGGHLVVGGGPDGPGTLAALPPELRAGELGQQTSLDAVALGAFTEAAPPPALGGLVLRPAPDALATGPRDAPLWARRQLGAGVVTQLAFDPGGQELRQWAGSPALWDRLLLPARRYVVAGGDFSPDPTQAVILSGGLAALPPITLPNATPLFALLAIYAILIGPGLALLLRRLDRQALGWFVLPAVALGITAIAVGLAVASRPDQRLANQLTLVEQVDATTARARASLGILGPRDERFPVAVGASAVARPLVAGTASFGVIAPAAGELGQDGAELDLNVKAWELQGAQVEALVALPALEAELRLAGGGIEATVRNTTGQPLRDVVVAYAGKVARIGDLAPGASGSAPWPAATPLGEPRPEATAALSTLVLGERLAAGRSPGSAPERRVLNEEALLSAAAIPGPEGEGLEPLVLAWLAQSPLPLALTANGLAVQQTTLLVSRVRIVGSGPALIPPGWMQLRQEGGQRQVCVGPQGRGLIASPAPLTITLVLPADLAGFRASGVTLDLQSERSWPNAGVTTELFDWQAGRWVAFPFDGPGTLALSDPAPYVQGGRLSVRLSGRIEEAGCVFADVALQGELPPGGQP